LDGVIAKRLDQPYLSGERAMQKIKNMRTADCVVGGFRYGTGSKNVGSLLLGLYNKGLLDHVGFTSSIGASSRAALTKKLEKLIQPPGFTGGAPGGPSRWSTDRLYEMAAAEAGAGRRGAVRSLYRRTVPARYEVPALASGQGS
jgi:ATP-dependent DNA ligase